MKYRILGIIVLFVGVLLTSCKGWRYHPLEDQAYIAQTEMKGFASKTALVHKTPTTTSFNVRVSHPASKEQVFRVIVDESVLTEYNTRTGQSHAPLPQEQFELQSESVKIAKGAVVSDDVNIKVLVPSQEMKDSGKSYAIALRIEGDANLLNGADRLVILIDQPAIQPVMQFNRTSNVELKLTDEIQLTNWTLEYFVKIDKLGKRIKELNNQAIFGAWGSGTDGRGGEIYTRFGDAPIEGNRFQVKNKGTQMNSQQLFEENKWYHIAVVCSDTKLELYVNGTLDNSMELPAGHIWINKTFGLGNKDYLQANVQIAQLRLWEVARTQTQIKSSMTRVDPKTEGLVAYWRFDEGQGDTFKDATGKNPDAVTRDNGHVTWVPDVKLD